ncbi:hypothetical protein HPULCUR_010351 [Helicostylum pulchrum]|uniref:Uncharacterized protein n=1 Tax=Helicostylum pulchrum TaxID=562976 RepID=A0ABP9YD13_9FUNG
MNMAYYNDRDIVDAYFRKIALHFTQLKSVSYNSDLEDEIWTVIENEWSRGRFSKLQVTPFDMIFPKYNGIVQYNAIAWSLRNNLRELSVYDVHPAPTQKTEILSHFTTLDTIYFKFRDFKNLYTIDQRIKKMRYVRSIDVDCFWSTNDTYHTPIQIKPAVHILPQIKQLDIRRFLYDSDIYPYIMEMFSGLDRINLLVKDSN